MLTPTQRKALKAKAHKLEPVVQIERALKAHELIKVRAGSLDLRANRRAVRAAGRQGVRALQEEGR